MLRLFTNLIPGALYFTKARVITWIDAFLAASHTLVACGKLLTRILLPAIKRLLLFLSGKVVVFQYIIGRGVKGRSGCSILFVLSSDTSTMMASPRLRSLTKIQPGSWAISSFHHRSRAAH